MDKHTYNEFKSVGHMHLVATAAELPVDKYRNSVVAPEAAPEP